MTGTTQLDEFLTALNNLIESGRTSVRDPDAFLKINQEIAVLIETGLQPLAEALAQGDLGADDRARLEESLAGIRDLEAKARARLEWSNDFEDYMRRALSDDE